MGPCWVGLGLDMTGFTKERLSPPREDLPMNCLHPVHQRKDTAECCAPRVRSSHLQVLFHRQIQSEGEFEDGLVMQDSSGQLVTPYLF